MNKRDDDRIDLESPLGIAGEPVAHDPLIHADNSEESRKRRRERALGPKVDERRSTGLGDLDLDTDGGATSIDMGHGDGNSVKGS